MRAPRPNANANGHSRLSGDKNALRVAASAVRAGRVACLRLLRARGWLAEERVALRDLLLAAAEARLGARL